MRPFLKTSLTLFALLTLLSPSLFSKEEKEPPVTFRFMSDVRPVLETRCVSCHGLQKQKGGLRLDREEDVLDADKYIVVPGKPEESELLYRITLDHEHDDIMPPADEGKLTPEQIAGIEAWIKAGAHWPERLVLRSPEPEEKDVEEILPLHKRIDALMAAGYDGPVSELANDGEFLRRLYLDLAGRIPTWKETQAFLEDAEPGKRERLIDTLLAGEDYPTHMAEVFSVYLMERRTKREEIPLADWEAYLRSSFESNKPWDVLMHEILGADGIDPRTRPAAKFYLDRRDVDLITADISRLMLGRDVGCAQCHDHPVYSDYTQAEYQGLYAYLSGSRPQKNSVTEETYFGESPLEAEVEYKSVFTEKVASTGPKLLHRAEIPVPEYERRNLYLSTYDKESGLPKQPRFQRRRLLAMHLPAPDNEAFRRNAANRLWFFMMGRGLVEPLDQHHSENAAAYPEVLGLLSEELYRLNFDIKAFLKELALTETYQRSSLLPENAEPAPETFATFILKPLSAEQMARCVVLALGVDEEDLDWDAVIERFREAYANPPGEPEVAFNSSMMDPFLLGNDPAVLEWFDPEKQKRGLVSGLLGTREAEDVVERLYLTVLSRYPTNEEQKQMLEFLSAAEDRDAKQKKIEEAVWALLASSEFRFNH